MATIGTLIAETVWPAMERRGYVLNTNNTH